jgi:hypothetical protein
MDLPAFEQDTRTQDAVKGQGRDLLLIPGLASDSRVWQFIEPELANTIG